MKPKKIISAFALLGMLSFSMIGASVAIGDVEPLSVSETLAPGAELVIDKQVTTPSVPTVVDICLLQDETGSFFDDIDVLQGTTSDEIFEAISVDAGADAYFGVAGFRDYPIGPYGDEGDWVYQLYSTMSPNYSDWRDGIDMLSAAGGGDWPEAQYDAIVAATGLSDYDGCGWRDPESAPGVQRVLIVATDATFHIPGEGVPHINDASSTIEALNLAGIKLIGLKGGDEIMMGDELDVLADATGGSVQPLSADSTNIVQAILAGLQDITTDVWWEATSTPGLSITLDPVVYYDVGGEAELDFTEYIEVADDSSLEGQTLEGLVTFIANTYPEEGRIIGRQTVSIYVPDLTPPSMQCIETTNPHGNKIPPAGSTTLPGSKGGQNDDGFYQLIATDNVDETVEIFVRDDESGTVFGPFATEDKLKITESNGATPTMKPMGSDKGKADAITAHLILNGDAIAIAIDEAGNTASTSCLVPPPPK